MAFMDGPDFSAAAREIYRVLRKGGRLYFSVTHPCFTTRDAQWVRDESEDVRGRLVPNYWDDQPFIEWWGFSAGLDQVEDVFAIQYFPYRLEDYINGLCEADFTISRIAEPRPTETMVSEHPRLAPFRRHVPHVLYVAAVK